MPKTMTSIGRRKAIILPFLYAWFARREHNPTAPPPKKKPPVFSLPPFTPSISSPLHPSVLLSRRPPKMPIPSKFLSPDRLPAEHSHHMDSDDDELYSPRPPSRNRPNLARYDSDISRAPDPASTSRHSRVPDPASTSRHSRVPESHHRSGTASGAYQPRRTDRLETRHSNSHISISSDDPAIEARDAEIAMLRAEVTKLKIERAKNRGEIVSLS